jgi:hypothetical protein
MFKNQNAIATQDVTNIQQQNFSQEKDLKIEELPIHTMAQDIYAIEHPNEKVYATSESSAEAVDMQKLNEKQKTSPFFDAAKKPVQPVAETPAKPSAGATPEQPTDMNNLRNKYNY